ncbi:MAG: hypothetical protein EOM84_01560 [Sphingobacteriia bacterium]|jgi:hypothetical protein|nr:hypothetical protein [Sphingobacteriia bacterium]
MKTLEKQYLFWDVDLKNLNPRINQGFIIERILQQGDLEDFHWALKFYGKDALQEVFTKNMQKFNRKSLNFWSLYFNIDFSLCIAKQLTRKQSAFWTK